MAGQIVVAAVQVQVILGGRTTVQAAARVSTLNSLLMAHLQQHTRSALEVRAAPPVALRAAMARQASSSLRNITSKTRNAGALGAPGVDAILVRIFAAPIVVSHVIPEINEIPH